MIARADKITAVTAPIVETDLKDRFRAARMSASGRVLPDRVDESSRSLTRTVQWLLCAQQQPFT